MLTATVALTASPGRIPEATAYLKELAKAAGAVSGAQVRVYASLFGPVGQFLVVSTYDSGGAWDAARQKTAGDARLQNMIQESAKSGLFQVGTSRGLWEEL